VATEGTLETRDRKARRARREIREVPDRKETQEDRPKAHQGLRAPPADQDNREAQANREIQATQEAPASTDPRVLRVYQGIQASRAIRGLQETTASVVRLVLRENGESARNTALPTGESSSKTAPSEDDPVAQSHIFHINFLCNNNSLHSVLFFNWLPKNSVVFLILLLPVSMTFLGRLTLDLENPKQMARNR
jgi:hypothetical protein